MWGWKKNMWGNVRSKKRHVRLKKKKKRGWNKDRTPEVEKKTPEVEKKTWGWKKDAWGWKKAGSLDFYVSKNIFKKIMGFSQHLDKLKFQQKKSGFISKMAQEKCRVHTTTSWTKESWSQPFPLRVGPCSDLDPTDEIDIHDIPPVVFIASLSFGGVRDCFRHQKAQWTEQA